MSFEDLSPAQCFFLGAGIGFTALAAGLGTYKVIQAITDEDFNTVEFPAWFRRELIDAHVRRHGCRCLECGRRVPRKQLTVDHIVALANGGLTSRRNARVMCRTCNCSKGAAQYLVDYVVGRWN